ncbi:hypothetical protein [Isoptericola sp. NPDC057191]|uniref:hypothetical protein n=1 Tax=Isoptericola sp. NPDC057191 TaxID=3346041 RepID=UPI00362A33E3
MTTDESTTVHEDMHLAPPTDGPMPVDTTQLTSELPDDEQAEESVERQRDELREFVSGLSGDDIKSGSWFTKLLAHALHTYTVKVDWQYFQDKYQGVPPDAIVDQRIKMATRYAAIEGGLSASAYTAAIVATLGSLGGASPATVPAAVATMMVDVAFMTNLQIRLAYDIAVLYQVPLNLDDPDDLWKLIRVAFTIRGGEVVRESAIKAVPAFVRPLLKRFYSGPVLAAAKGLPVVGKYLLQRNVIKIGIPLVGIPIAVVLNRYTTKITGRHARSVFRNDARVIELARSISGATRHPRLVLWVSWLVVMADDKVSDDEALLLRHLVTFVRDEHQVVDDRLAKIIDLDMEEVWRRIDTETGDLTDIVDAAHHVAAVDGDINDAEREVLRALQDRCADTGVPALGDTTTPGSSS